MRLLLRRWQVIILVISLLQPLGGPGPLVDIAVLPFSVLLSTGHDFWWRFTYIVMLQIFWAVWASMQREQICGGKFMQYAQSLPLSQAILRRINLVVLLLADSPLLLMILVTGVSFGIRETATDVLLVDYLYLLTMTLLFLATQLAVLDRSYAFWIMLPANLLLASALGISALQPKIILMSVLCVIATAAILGQLPLLPVKRFNRLRNAIGIQLASRFWDRLHPALQISIGILFRQHYSEMLSKGVSSVLILAASIGLMEAWNYDYRSLPLTLIALAGIALSVSGLYRGMHLTHLASGQFTSALPLPLWWWRWFDVITVLSFGLCFAVALNSILVSHHGASLSSMVISLAAFALLLYLLRFPQLQAERHSVLCSSLITGVWTALMFHFLV